MAPGIRTDANVLKFGIKGGDQTKKRDAVLRGFKALSSSRGASAVDIVRLLLCAVDVVVHLRNER